MSPVAWRETGALSKAQPRAVLWDVDGTLVDSSSYHWIAWRDALARVGHSLTRDEFERTFGLRNDAILRMLIAPDISAERISAIEADKEAQYRQQVAAQGIELLPGALAWLERLSEDGWSQAVASSAPAANVDAVLQATGTQRFFDAVITGEDVVHGKPEPDSYFAAAKRLGVPVGRCVVVEDAPAAIKGSVAAGLKTIGLLPEGHSVGANLEASSLDRLPANAFDQLIPLNSVPA